MTKIKVFGWYNKNNIGDESYKISFPMLFKNKSLIFSDELDYQEDNVILGGGNVLNNTFLSKFNKLKCSKLCLSVSATEKQEVVCDKIFVRDFKSLDYIKNSVYLPDLAFLLEPNKNRGLEIIKNLIQGQQDKGRYIACILNSHLLDNLNSLSRDSIKLNNFIYDLARFFDKLDYTVIFLPFGRKIPWDDRIIHGIIASKCLIWQKNVLIYKELNVQDTLDLISCCDLTISQRLHSTIFSCISSTPFVDITHHDKNKNFLETIQQQNKSINYWEFSLEKLKDLVNKILLNLEKEKENLNKIVFEQRAILKDKVNDIRFD